MKIVLTGIQGAGKSTQGNLLSTQLKIPYLSTGHIFREIAKKKTKLGRYVKELITAGSLIPDIKTVEIVNQYLSKPEYKKGYILDGFPRTVDQIKDFKNAVDKVIHIDIPDKEALWRLAYRNDNGRNDDNIKAILKRIELFNKHTRPVLDYYREKGKLEVVDGMQTEEQVNEEILKRIGKQLIENHIKNWRISGKKIIALVGMPGAGKTEASDFFRSRNLPVISFSHVINSYVDENNLEHTEEVHKKLRKEFRDKHGFEAMAVLNKEKIEKGLKKNDVLIIEGMRSWEEYLYLKENFKDVQINIVCLFASKELRYKRLSQRKYRGQLFGEERDINELIGTNMGPTIAFSDHLIVNNDIKSDLHEGLKQVYNKIYFS